VDQVVGLAVMVELTQAEQVIHPLLALHKAIMAELQQYQAVQEVQQAEAVLVR
jgi:hypothetical protein